MEVGPPPPPGAPTRHGRRGSRGGTITYSLPDHFTSYNNGTAEDNLTSNQYATNQVVPNVSYFDDKGGTSINKELVDVQKTSDSPLTVVYKFNPKAVWDAAPIGCDDMYLYWVANNGVNKTTTGQEITLFPSSHTGFDQINKVDCSADGKTVTYTYGSPFSDWGLVTDQGSCPPTWWRPRPGWPRRPTSARRTRRTTRRP